MSLYSRKAIFLVFPSFDTKSGKEAAMSYMEQGIDMALFVFLFLYLGHTSFAKVLQLGILLVGLEWKLGSEPGSASYKANNPISFSTTLAQSISIFSLSFSFYNFLATWPWEKNQKSSGEVLKIIHT